MSNQERQIQWNAYLLYLKDWAKYHSNIGFYGMTPACFDEWLTNDDIGLDMDKDEELL